MNDCVVVAAARSLSRDEFLKACPPLRSDDVRESDGWVACAVSGYIADDVDLAPGLQAVAGPALVIKTRPAAVAVEVFVKGKRKLDQLWHWSSADEAKKLATALAK